MPYLIWSVPTLVVIAAIASGRVSTVTAAALGVLAAVPVAVWAGPQAGFALDGVVQALLRGGWIGVTIAPYILGGLLFWQLAARAAAPEAASAMPDAHRLPTRARRRLVFFACFLVGPFAESATGFGVGMLGTVAMIRPLGLAPRHVMIFALLSQTLIPWGAMGSGTMLAAAYTRMPATDLALYAMPLVALLMGVWLLLFWRTARQAGLGAARGEYAAEAGWIAAALALLALATWQLGPETALLAGYGPLIVLRFLADERPDAARLRQAVHAALPFVVLIGALVLTRMPAVAARLRQPAFLPYADLPAWQPLFHAGSWLVAGGVLTALWRGQGRTLPAQAAGAWRTGRNAVYTVFLFAMMAEILTAAGISQAFARGMFEALQAQAILFTPVLSGVFGILANSGNAPNSLFMPSQVALALQAGFSVLAVAAIQHVSGSQLSLFSPVRMSIAAGLAQGAGQERAVYVALLPYALAAALLLTLAAGVLIGLG